MTDKQQDAKTEAQGGWWARWPHPFPPTHWRPLPDPQPDGQEG